MAMSTIIPIFILFLPMRRLHFVTAARLMARPNQPGDRCGGARGNIAQWSVQWSW